MGASDPSERPAQRLWEGHTAPVEGTPPAEPVQHRRWLHPATLTVLGAALLVTFAVSMTMVVSHLSPEPLELSDLTPGLCLVSDDLRDEAPQLTDLKRVNCTERHDAEVFAVLPDATGADDLVAAGKQCVAMAGLTLDEIQARGLEVRPITRDTSIAERDLVICLARDTSGDGLRGPTMMRSLDTDVED